MFFPESIWSIIKEYLFDELHDTSFIFWEIAKVIPSPFKLSYETNLSFYYQAKHHFAFFLQEWFEKTLAMIAEERQITLWNLEKNPQSEWKLHYYKFFLW